MYKSLMENLKAMGCNPEIKNDGTVKINAPVMNSKTIGYTIKAKCPEGKYYYLINGWYKHFGFWLRLKDVLDDFRKAEKITFKTAGSAKASLTKLLKIMPDYKTDIFTLCKITESSNIIDIEEIKTKC
jgi:hypothetical protein